MTIRKIIFWAHLVAGVVAGLVIGIMCLTGAALAFEKELTAWSERDARQIDPPPAGTARIPLEELQARVRAAYPAARPTTIVVQNDPSAAVAFTAGRTVGFYVNPYTGEVRQPRSNATAVLMQSLIDWHRYLSLSGEVSRPRGKLINGICNVAFCVLAVTGLYLWMPRSWSWRSVRGIALFNWKFKGQARDFNWHNVVGLWTAPLLIVLTVTAMPISFRWAANAIFTLTGTEPPGAAPMAPIAIPGQPGVPLFSREALLAIAQKELPEWTTLTLRLDSAEAASGKVQAVTFTARLANSWPRTATTTLSLNPFSGEVLRRSGYAEQNAALQVRAWTRFLHTGEALGWAGQIFAGIACAGGCVLVWTGLALAWRRFWGRKLDAPVPATPK
ncbi:MAG: hypothetical protein RIQ93_1862 [Verrucomicrobiota bacterium]|jgi:uncharacterized iron-regulated membrane protein